MIINIGHICGVQIDKAIKPVFIATKAMQLMRGMNSGFDAPGRLVVSEALDAYKVHTNDYRPKQMSDARVQVLVLFKTPQFKERADLCSI